MRLLRNNNIGLGDPPETDLAAGDLGAALRERQARLMRSHRSPPAIWSLGPIELRRGRCGIGGELVEQAICTGHCCGKAGAAQAVGVALTLTQSAGGDPRRSDGR